MSIAAYRKVFFVLPQTDYNEIITQIADNKAKGRISKRVFQENKARQIFWKTKITYPLKRMSYYQRNDARLLYHLFSGFFSFF